MFNSYSCYIVVSVRGCSPTAKYKRETSQILGDPLDILDIKK